MYADVTNLLSINSAEKEVYTESQRQLHLLNNWIEKNTLTENLRKTFYMFYHKTKNKMDNSTKLKINSEEILEINELHFLGIIIDKKLTFKKHVNNICNKIKVVMKLAYKLRYKINDGDKMNIY